MIIMYMICSVCLLFYEPKYKIRFEPYTNMVAGIPLSRNSCFKEHPNQGCNNVMIQDCVCKDDPFCCVNWTNFFGVWDNKCVNKAYDCLNNCGKNHG